MLDLKGIFALSIINADEPDMIIAVRQGPPVVIGLGNREFFVASDIPPILQHTRDVFFLGDGEMAIINKEAVRVTDFEANSVQPAIQRITWDPIMAEKGGFKHFMLKEIYEQPRSVRDTVQGRISLDTGRVFLDEMKNITEDDFKRITSIKIAACGTSWHAGLAGKYMIEQLARVPVDVDYASEFRYRDPVVDEHSLLLVISQSGETADTIAALREARERGAKVLAICNVQGSMIVREADGTILTHAGPEIGVASTKAFTAQMVALYLLGLYLGGLRGALSPDEAKHHAQQLAELPVKLEHLLNESDEIEELSKEFFRVTDFLYLGRGINFPVALEGALKLKEISYIHAEGYPAGEMKHGPNALIDERLPVLFINTREDGNRSSELRYEKTHSNIVEVKAREGIVISVLTEGDTMSSDVSDYVISIPPSSDLLSPILSIIPLQLLAYHIAVRRGCDVDQPRNLAKSVTVE
jgi:glucosamine--fructose-6-phosphate aminotransferase (isomerizing)